VLEAGRPSAVYRRRLRRAATLALKDERLQVLLTGGGEPSEAAVGRDWLQVETGLSPARIHLEEWSTDTFANLQHARAILPEGACVGLVSSRFHLARVSVYARHLGLRTVPVPAEANWRFTPACLLARPAFFAGLCAAGSGPGWPGDAHCSRGFAEPAASLPGCRAGVTKSGRPFPAGTITACQRWDQSRQET
jgi:hypothetical protein